MNKPSNFFSIALLVFIFYSCNKIDEKTVFEDDSDGKSCTNVTFATRTNPHRKVLLEDYTGHYCVPCAAAHNTIKNEIVPAYADSVIPVAIHAGGLADVYPAATIHESFYTNDFRTTAGNAYFELLIKNIGTPKGLINRINYNPTGEEQVKDPTEWKSLIGVEVKKAPLVDVQIKNDYSSNDSSVCIHVQTTALTNLPLAKYNLVVWLIEDNIIAPQYALTHELQYVHNHVLRTCITDANGYGKEIIKNTETINATKTIYKKFKYKILSKYKNVSCNVNECYIVAFVCNATTKEILQTEIEKVN